MSGRAPAVPPVERAALEVHITGVIDVKTASNKPSGVRGIKQLAICGARPPASGRAIGCRR